MPTGKVEWKRTARNNWLRVFVLEHASLCDIHNGFTSHAHAAAAMHLQRCATKRPEATFIVSDCLNTVYQLDQQLQIKTHWKLNVANLLIDRA